MKFFVVFAAVLAAAVAATMPMMSDKEVYLVKSDMDMLVDGYKFNFETSDGVAREEVAVVVNPGAEDETIAVKGSYRWVSPEGVEFVVKYVADENGFQPEGVHLPKMMKA